MKPIIFSTTMVKAILDYTKTMTRRVVKPKYKADEEGFTVFANVSTGEKWLEKHDEDEMSFDPPRYIYPKYQVGDILWVREMHFLYKNTVYFKADEKHFELEKLGIKFKWKSPYHLYCKDARIFLKVKSVRIERLQEITEEDAIKEGSYLDRCECRPHKNDKTAFDKLFVEKWCHIHGAEFKDLWNSLNAKRGYAWERNPFVWVYEFERLNKEEVEV